MARRRGKNFWEAASEASGPASLMALREALNEPSAEDKQLSREDRQSIIDSRLQAIRESMTNQTNAEIDKTLGLDESSARARAESSKIAEKAAVEKAGFGPGVQAGIAKRKELADAKKAENEANADPYVGMAATAILKSPFAATLPDDQLSLKISTLAKAMRMATTGVDPKAQPTVISVPAPKVQKAPPTGKIPIIRLSDGMPGFILPGEFDPKIYKKR